MLVQLYRIVTVSSTIYYILLREDDYNITLSLRTVNRIRSGISHRPNFTDAVSHTLFMFSDTEITPLGTVPEEEAFGFLDFYATLMGD